MKTVFVEGALGGWTEPHGIIHSCGDGGVGFFEYCFHPALVCPSFDEADVTEFAGMDEIGCVFPVFVGALPLSDLDDFVVVTGGDEHCVALFDGSSDGFFAIDVFSCLDGVDHH